MMPFGAKARITPPRPGFVCGIGVVGHRPRDGSDLDAGRIPARLAGACRAVEDAVLALHRQASSVVAPGAPTLTLICALAEGADQVAAEAFLAAPPRDGLVRRLEVVLPFARAAYMETFDALEAIGRFDSLIERADAVLEIADWSLAAAEDPIGAHRRDRRFETAGDIVRRQADVLLAVWDGLPARGRGGTADTVLAAMAEGKPILWIHSETGETRLLHDLPRHGDAFALIAEAPALSAVDLKTALSRSLEPPAPDADASAEGPASLPAYLGGETVREATGWRVYDMLLAQPARLKVARKANPGARKAGRSHTLRVDYVRQMVADPAWAGFAGRAIDGWIGRLKVSVAGPWSAADAVATRLGHIYRSIYLLIYVLGAAAVAFGLTGLFCASALRWDAMEPVFSGVELLCLAAACFLYWIGRRKAHHARWLNARALGEQFRAYWPLAFLGLGGRRALGTTAQWPAWLFNAHVAAVGLPDDRLDPPALRAIAQGMQDAIVLDQIAYHDSNRARLAAIHERLESWGARLLVFSLCASLVLLLLSLAEIAGDFRLQGVAVFRPFQEAQDHLPLRLLSVLAAALPAFGAAAAGVRFQGDFERFSERSKETNLALSRIQLGLERFIGDIDTLGEAPPPAPLFETLRDLASDLERVLLSDLEDWRFVYRARPISGPE